MNASSLYKVKDIH